MKIMKPSNRCNLEVLHTTHYGHRVERDLKKLPSRRQGRSPLKYTNCGVYITLESKVYLLKESLDFN
jgi:hypothetical protein